MALLPPVLDSRGTAINYVPADEYDELVDYYELFFLMPSNNSIDDIENGHIQVLLKTQSNNRAAVSTIFSPDNQVIYIQSNAIDGNNVRFLGHVGDGLWRLRIPYKAFLESAPKNNTNYLCQVRFGTSPLWGVIPAGEFCPAVADSGNFSAWRNTQVTAVPSLFGEWSNLQTVYCSVPPTKNELEYNYNNYIPEVTYEYQSDFDPIAQVSLVYHYISPFGGVTKVINPLGNTGLDGSFYFSLELPIAPLADITVSLQGVTKNNRIISAVEIIPTYPHYTNTRWRLSKEPVIGDIIDEGAIWVKGVLT